MLVPFRAFFVSVGEFLKGFCRPVPPPDRGRHGNVSLSPTTFHLPSQQPPVIYTASGKAGRVRVPRVVVVVVYGLVARHYRTPLL